MALLEPGFLRKLEALALWAEQPGRGQRGERSARSAGSGVAFAGHRAYAAGDDFRFIDFALYARSDRLHVKQFEEERELAIELLLDCSGSMEAKLPLAKQLAAALGYLALVHSDRVAVQPFASAPLARLEPLRGARRALLLLRHLEALRADGGTDLLQAARAVRARTRRGGLAFVISDGYDVPNLLAGIDVLRHAHLAPVVLLLEHAEEASPSLDGELTLVDRETGEERVVTVDARVLARYREAYRRRRQELRSGLRERHVRTFELDSATPIEHAVLSLLRRGGVVR
ncbi:MAG TPA: DUF58 domain-containing protein [Polyangiales bacterium]|nr:DUF58 domain-containing protein [Polyangiales bacterium]